MRKMILGLLILGCAVAGADENRLRLIYDEPAAEWTDALPLGNGSMGAMVFGGVNEERIQFNHDTLWAGKPRSYSNPGAVEVLPELRELLFDGKQKDAEDLAMERFMSKPMRQAPYQPFGDLVLEFPDLGTATNYQRALDLDGALATTEFTAGGIAFKRSVFASHPDGVIAVRLEADQPGALNLTARLTTLHEKATVIDRFDGRTLRMNGVVDDFKRENKKKNWKSFFEGTVEFEARLRAEVEGGTLVVEDNGIKIKTFFCHPNFFIGSNKNRTSEFFRIVKGMNGKEVTIRGILRSKHNDRYAPRTAPSQKLNITVSASRCRTC